MSHDSLYSNVRELLKENRELTSHEIYERVKDKFQDVNQHWVRRNIVSYRAQLRNKL